METNYVNARIPSPIPRDIKVFTFIEAYIRFHGFSPTFEEIAADIKCPKQSITRTIARLERMGCITRTTHIPRSILPIKSPITFVQTQ